MPGVDRRFATSCGCGDVGGRCCMDCIILAGYSQCRPALMQWLQSGCFSLHLILRRLQLKQPRRDFVCPFLGIGFRGSGGALSMRQSDRVGESLEELSILPVRPSADSIDNESMMRVQHTQDAGQPSPVAIYRYSFGSRYHWAATSGP